MPRMHSRTPATIDSAAHVEPAGAPTTAPGPVRPDTRTWLRERIGGRVALGVGLSWVVLLEIAFLLEPPARTDEPVIGLALGLAMNALIITMIVGLVMRKRWGLLASLGGALLATAASVARPISGHHGFGAWWFGQMACVMTLVAISAAALRRDYPQAESAPA